LLINNKETDVNAGFFLNFTIKFIEEGRKELINDLYLTMNHSYFHVYMGEIKCRKFGIKVKFAERLDASLRLCP
jgi:hypothetical protein